MIRLLIFILLLISSLCVSSQEKYFTKTGHIYFMSHTDAIDIDANNRQVVSFLNVKTGELVFAALIKSFEFSLATASEHFNETYMESHKFPKATFKGKIDDFGKLDLTKPGVYDVTATGSLNIHGVTNEITTKAKITVAKESLLAHCELKINIDQYSIKVPKLVEDRVAKTVDVKLDINYLPFVQ